VNARLKALGQAVERLRAALDVSETDLTRDATIQRFEFCFELAWKNIQEKAHSEGLDCVSPRNCLKTAFKAGWIDDEAGWLAMLEDRNRTVHTYDETLAKAIYARIVNYMPLLESLVQKLTE
jgi:nucleotidyltransferase substrate binding protein (TIGR01987 family)